LIRHGAELYARCDSGLYRSLLESDAWAPFGPQGIAIQGFARTGSGWVVFESDAFSAPNYPTSTRVYVSKDEGAQWTKVVIPGWADGMASSGDTLFAYTVEDPDSAPGRWSSVDGGLNWKVSAFNPPGRVSECAIFPGGLLCAASEGIYRGQFNAGEIGPGTMYSAGHNQSALGWGGHLYVIDTLGILRKLGAGGEVWKAPALPRGASLLAASDSAVVAHDYVKTYFAEAKPDRWTVIPSPFNANRFVKTGVWAGGQGYFPALHAGVHRVKIVAGALEATPFGRGMDRPWVTIQAPMASRLYARTGGAFWRLDAVTGVFHPYFQDSWGGAASTFRLPSMGHGDSSANFPPEAITA
jgi:hypothetical protein